MNQDIKFNNTSSDIEKKINYDPAKANQGYMVFYFGVPGPASEHYAKWWRSMGKDILHLSKSESATVCTTFLIFADTPARFEIRFLAFDSNININTKVEHANCYKSALDIHRKMRDDFESEHSEGNDIYRWKVWHS